MAAPLRRYLCGGRLTLPRLAIALLFACVLAAATPGPALAGSDGYTCGVINPSTYCQAAYQHHAYLNVADYPGAGTVPVCARAIRASNGSEWARACANNNVGVNYSNSVLTIAQVLNASRYRHTINGRVYF
jgi:hypothetical protein